VGLSVVGLSSSIISILGARFEVLLKTSLGKSLSILVVLCVGAASYVGLPITGKSRAVPQTEQMAPVELAPNIPEPKESTPIAPEVTKEPTLVYTPSSSKPTPVRGLVTGVPDAAALVMGTEVIPLLGIDAGPQARPCWRSGPLQAAWSWPKQTA
jgi:hypothetical protein